MIEGDERRINTEGEVEVEIESGRNNKQKRARDPTSVKALLSGVSVENLMVRVGREYEKSESR